MTLFLSRYVTMTDNLSNAFQFSRGIFTLFTPSIIGEFIETNSYVFIVVNVVYIVSSLFMYFVINYLIVKYRKNMCKLGDEGNDYELITFN